MIKLLFCLLILVYPLFAKEERVRDHVLEEIQGDIEDLKHALHATKTDLSLLEGKIKNHGIQQKVGSEPSGKLELLEKRQEKIQKDLQAISDHLNQVINLLAKESEKIREVEKTIGNQKQYTDEMSKLKETLLTLIKTIKDPTSNKGSKTYKVKNGDSLEKIARLHHISVEELMKVNHLNDDRIFVNQELQLP